MKVTIHARHDDASALALAGLIAIVRPAATIDFAPSGEPEPGTIERAEASGTSALSIRETLVMNRLAAGKNVVECAEELRVSPATVQVYAARARSKLAALPDCL